VPPVRAAAGVIVRKVIPGRPTGAVVLPHRSPGPLAQIRPPALPVLLPLPGLLEPAFLCTRGRGTELGDGGAHGASSWRTWPSGSGTGRGRGAEDNAGRRGRVTKLACASRRPDTSAGPSRESIRTCQWKTSLPRSSAG